MNFLQHFLQQILMLLENLGPYGPLAFIPIFILGTFLLISIPLMTLIAGALFGIPTALMIVSGSSVASAGIVFLAGRYWSRAWVLQKIAESEKMRAIDDAVSKTGWKMVGLLRLTSVVPFSIMNYALGLSKIRFKPYLLATWVGMLPGMFLYVYLGALAGEVILKGSPRHITYLEWAFLVLGVIATIGVSIYATLVVKKAVKSTHKVSVKI